MELTCRSALLAILPAVCLAASPSGAMDLQPVGSLVGLPPYAVVTQGDYAYCAAESLYGFDNNAHAATTSALEIYDISDPTEPRVVGVLSFEEVIPDLVVVGEYVYTDGVALHVVDVSDPTTPSEVGTIGLPAAGICASGSHLYLADPETGIHILDLSNPAAPAEVGIYACTAHQVSVADGLAYVSCGDMILVLDVSEPGSVTEVGRVDRDVYGDPLDDAVTPLAIAGEAAAYHVSGGPDCVIVDISDPSQPVVVAEHDVSDIQEPSMGLAALGSYLCVTFDGDGVAIVDISSPADPVDVASWATPGHALGIAVAGGRAYVADYEGGLRIYDLSDPADPQVLGATGAPGFTKALCTHGHLLLGAAWHRHQLTLFDISQPASPTFAQGSLGGGDSFGTTVAAVGDYAYLGAVGTSAGLCVVGLPGADTPGPGWLENMLGTTALAHRGDYVYAGADGRLIVLDVSDPGQPAELARTGYIDPCEDAALNAAGTHVFLASGLEGLRVMDVSNPRHPTGAALLDTEMWAEAVSVSGNYAYLGGDDLIAVYDIRDPDTPTAVASWGLEGLSVQDLEIVGSYLYVADAPYGLRVLGITDPLNLVEVENCALPHGPEWQAVEGPPGASGLAVSGGHIYVADYGWGIYVFELSSTFADVPVDHWAADAIERCASSDVVQGFTADTYAPDLPVTRGQMAVYLSRALAGGEANVPPGPAEPTFPDVPADHWAFDHIEYVAGLDVVYGYAEGDYRPDVELDRGQMAVFIARAACGGEDAVPDPGCEEPVFPDVPCDFWARKYIQWIEAEGITAGFPDGNYHPEIICTRDQMAVYVTRAFDLSP